LSAADAQNTFVPDIVPTEPPDPEVERKSFQVADGFEVNLWAADPMLAKPIQMNWDAQGRLWVASSSMYPQIKPGEAPQDKVIVLEDTDNNGQADKSTVFADGLLIPTGLEPGDGGEWGGAYVANSTEILHLKDTDGDGKADQRRVVLSGFGTEDTHHMIHTFRWGLDGRMYINQSIYIHSHVETPHGVRRLMGSGTWRFHPETMNFDVVSRGMVNPWGHAFDDWGNSFQTDGAGGGGIYYVFPGAAFQSAVGYERVLDGMNPGSPKYCGLEIVNGRHLPDDWQGNAITNDFRANRIVRYQLADENGVFVSKPMPDVVTSTDVAFRPIDVKMGPDGAIYVADWYNPIINHGEVDFRDPRRDKTRGRIWRITAKGRKLVEKPKLVGAPVADLLEHLKRPESWTRQQAKLVLRSFYSGMGVSPLRPGEKHGRDAHATVNARAEVIRSLGEWVTKLDAKDPLRERHRVEALWVYQTLETPEPKLLGELLNSKTPQARAAATRVVPDWAKQLPEAMELLAARVKDENPRVRIEAVRALARFNSPRAVELAMTALDKPRDANLDYALWVTAFEMQGTWIPAYKSGELKFSDNPQHATFALQAVKSPEAAVVLAKQLAAGSTPPNERGNVLELIASVGGPEQVTVMYDLATADATDAALRTAALRAVDKSIRQRKVEPAGADVAKLSMLLDAADDNVRIAAIRLAGAWRAADVTAALKAIAEAAETKPPVRQAAISSLADRGKENADFVRSLDAPDRAFDVRAMALVALSAMDLNDAANRAVGLLADAPDKTDAGGLIAGFLSRQGGGEALNKAIGRKKLTAEQAKLAMRAVESTGRDEPALLERLRDAAGVKVAASKGLSPGQMARRVEEVKRYGNASLGEALFRNATLGCFKCHAIHGAGSTLGPDLGSIGASSPIDYLIDSMLDPNKQIKDGYQATIVATKDGDVHSAIKVSQDDTQIILRDAVQDRIVVPLNRVKSERPGGSIMPTGLTDALQPSDFLHLVRFLSELGKPGPYQANPAQLVRRWRMLPPPAAEKLIADAAPLRSAQASAKLPWAPNYSLVSGELPPDAMAAEGQQIAFVRGEIEVTAPGRIGLSLGEARGLSMWVNETPVDVKSDLVHRQASTVEPPVVATPASRSTRGVEVLTDDSRVRRDRDAGAATTRQSTPEKVIEIDLAAGVHTLTFKVDVGERGQALRVEVRDVAGSGAHARPVGGR
ncbi:MAG: HEAT repeat domain-containing protein, partial [Planctomycetota bacterium]|nr:HEAT repeat domain-containing protein [Planctomycetota bacterium]